METRKAIVFDLDGTLNSFKEMDHEIIQEIFSKHGKLPFLVKWMDAIMWFINDLEMMGNTMPKLMFRFQILSFISGLMKEDIFRRYKRLYRKKNARYLQKREDFLKQILVKGFIPLIVSNNGLSSGMQVAGDNIITVVKKEKELEYLKERYQIQYLVGNNYCDDIKNARKIGAIPIYVGGSPIVKCLMKKNEKIISHIEQIFEIIG